MLTVTFARVILCVLMSADAQQLMQSHSFDKEIGFPTFVSRWWNIGASIPLENHIVLTPSVQDRFGAQWHKQPLLTDDFEVTFTVVVKPPASGVSPPNDQGFAFWYVYENVSSVMPEELRQQETNVVGNLIDKKWGLFGYRNDFKGLGVFFSNNRKGSSEGVTEFKPSVSMLVNDGTRTVVLPVDVPTPFGSYWNYRNGNLHIRLRVQKQSVLLEGRQDGNKNWIKLGEVPKDKMPMQVISGGYIGFTGMIGADKPGAQSKFGDHDTVLIDNVVLTNMDPNQKGEEAPAVVPDKASDEKLSEFLHDKSEEGVERAEGKAIKRFTQILFKFISETEPQKKAMISAVSTLSTKLASMERAVKKLKEEIVQLSGHDMDADYQKMKTELSQLSSKALTDVEGKKKQLETIKAEIDASIESKVIAKKASTANVVKTLHDVNSKALELRDQLASRGSFTIYVAVVCLVLVLAAGVALQIKLKRWEKKHLL